MTRKNRTESVERELASARRVDLVNAEGHRRVMVVAHKEGPHLVLFDNNGELGAVLLVGEGDPLKMQIVEKGDLPGLLTIRTDKMHLALYDEGQRVRSTLPIGDLPSIVELRNAQDKRQAVICLDASKLEFLLHDAEGRIRSSLSMGDDGGFLRLLDESGKVFWSAP